MTSTPLICQRNIKDKMGFVVSTGEPKVIDINGIETPLMDWNPEGLFPPFEPNFLFTGPFTQLGKSSIVRKSFLGNQSKYIHGSCIRLPIHSFERFPKRGTKHGTTAKVVQTTRRSKKDCVSFQPGVAELVIELEWDSRDDFDLSVIAPGGGKLNKNTRSNPGSGLHRDSSTEKCFSGKPPSSKERVLFRTLVPSGRYTIRAFHHTNCGAGPTRWRLRVTYKNELIFSKNKADDGDFSSLVFKYHINI